MDQDRMDAIIRESRVIFIQEKLLEFSSVSKSLLNYSLQKSRDDYNDVRRFFHTVKGTAAMLKLDELSQTGGEYEELMDSFEGEAEIPADCFIKISGGLAKIFHEIEQLYDELCRQGNFNGPVPENMAGESDKAGDPGRKGNLLIIDDDVALLDQLEKVFTESGYRVIITAKPQEITQYIAEENIDLILLDIIMPEVNGFDALELLKNAKNQIPVIFLTAKALTEDKVKALRSGVDDYITKPFDYNELLARVERSIERMGSYRSQIIRDNLTGAYTRTYFYERVKEARARLSRKNEPFSIAFMDLDDFKEINDSYGHLAGDYVLESFSKELQRNLRTGDQLYRFGGDEFLVLFPDTKGEDAGIIIERIRKIIDDKDFLFDGMKKPIRISFSAGVTTAEDKDETVQQLIEKADLILYEAKSVGKGITRLYATRKAEDSVTGYDESRKKVLIIDDANIIVNIVKARLDPELFHVAVANDGEMGLMKGKSFKPDLMIVDLMLPKLSGFDVCREIKANPDTKDTRIIIMSSRNYKNDILKCFSLGVDGYIVKPFSPAELEARIRKILKMQ